VLICVFYEMRMRMDLDFGFALACSLTTVLQNCTGSSNDQAISDFEYIPVL
jgi:hypothetical protein